MKVIFLLITLMLISGCVPYSKRSDLSHCLLTGKDSNEEVINKINIKKNVKIKEIKPLEYAQIDRDGGDGTMCKAIATYDNETSSRGFITSTGRWSHPQVVNYDFLTDSEKNTKEYNESIEKQKIINDRIKESQELAEKSNREFENADSNKYPYIAEVYCYNKRTLELYSPATCGPLASGETGPTNIYDKTSPVFKLMLGKNFKLKVITNEPHPLAGIKVDVRSRKTDEVIETKIGDFNNTVIIGG